MEDNTGKPPETPSRLAALKAMLPEKLSTIGIVGGLAAASVYPAIKANDFVQGTIRDLGTAAEGFADGRAHVLAGKPLSDPNGLWNVRDPDLYAEGQNLGQRLGKAQQDLSGDAPANCGLPPAAGKPGRGR